MGSLVRPGGRSTGDGDPSSPPNRSRSDIRKPFVDEEETREALKSIGERRACRGMRADGEECRSVVVARSGWCFTHDPNKADERNEARRRGGAGSSNVARLRRHLGPSQLGSIFTRLEEALEELHTGRLSPNRASAMASVARAMVTVLQAGELEERIQAIEERLSG